MVEMRKRGRTKKTQLLSGQWLVSDHVHRVHEHIEISTDTARSSLSSTRHRETKVFLRVLKNSFFEVITLGKSTNDLD
jgi:hypothetical protein